MLQNLLIKLKKFKIIQEYEVERDEVEKYYRYQVVENGVKV